MQADMLHMDPALLEYPDRKGHSLCVTSLPPYIICELVFTGQARMMKVSQCVVACVLDEDAGLLCFR
uniref:Uncharacterized protein n=1 Tax=Anguilla anguilla TaxID=7936 RepID=A0A0E9PNW3_ANGAN